MEQTRVGVGVRSVTKNYGCSIITLASSHVVWPFRLKSLNDCYHTIAFFLCALLNHSFCHPRGTSRCHIGHLMLLGDTMYISHCQASLISCYCNISTGKSGTLVQFMRPNFISKSGRH